jgi:hypothetical protein
MFTRRHTRPFTPRQVRDWLVSGPRGGVEQEALINVLNHIVRVSEQVHCPRVEEIFTCLEVVLGPQMEATRPRPPRPTAQEVARRQDRPPCRCEHHENGD